MTIVFCIIYLVRHLLSRPTLSPYTTLFRSEAEDGADDREGIDKLAWPLVHLAAEQGRERRRQPRRHLALVNEIAQGQTRQHERYPHVCGKVVVRKFKRSEERRVGKECRYRRAT